MLHINTITNTQIPLVHNHNNNNNNSWTNSNSGSSTQEYRCNHIIDCNECKICFNDLFQVIVPIALVLGFVIFIIFVI